ncbi:MAG: hypothetical protein ACP5OV_07910 [Acidimicrobiales bacterium]
MLLVVIALLWATFLIPWAVRHLREWRGERAINHFSVETAPRLRPVAAPAPRPVPARPRLRVVHEGDTYQSLEAERSWDEWMSDYEFDEVAAPMAHQRPPAWPPSAPAPRVVAAPGRQPMRRRRRVVFTRLAALCVVATLLAWLTHASVIWDVTFTAWSVLVAFVALAIYAVGKGYLDETSVGLGFLGRRGYLEPVQEYGARHPVTAPRVDAWGHVKSAAWYADEARSDDDDGSDDDVGAGPFVSAGASRWPTARTAEAAGRSGRESRYAMG